MLRFILLISAAIIVMDMNAQIGISSSDMPQAGDTIRKSSALNIAGYDFTVTGEDYTWDYGGLNPVAQSVDTFVSVSSTPWLYQIVFLTSANLAKPLQDFDQIPNFQVTDAYEYYNNKSSGFSLVGFAVTLNGLPFPNKFDSPDKIYQFPLQYGNVDSSFSTYDIGVPGLGYVGGWKKRVNNADGWGTLITPFGSFETLRLRSSISQYDSVYIDSLGMGFPLMREYTEYKWLGQDFGVPLLEVVDDALNPVVNYIDSVRNLLTGTGKNYMEDGDLTIYPNPASEKFTLEARFSEIPGEIYISIADQKGTIVADLHTDWQGEKHLKKSISLKDYGLQSGLYVVQLRSDQGIVRKKLLVK